MAHLCTAGPASLRAGVASTVTRAADSSVPAAQTLSLQGCPGSWRQGGQRSQVACTGLSLRHGRQCRQAGKGLPEQRVALEVARCSAEAKESSTDTPKAATPPSSPPSTSSPPKAAAKGKKGGFGKAAPPPAPKKEKPASDSIFAQAPAPSPGPRGARVARRPAPQQPLLSSDQTSEQDKQTETAIVSTLVLIFSIILLEGIFLAAAGFLPEEWDEFALDTIYPAFSPTVGLFLLCAAGYGLYKFLGPQQK